MSVVVGLFSVQPISRSDNNVFDVIVVGSGGAALSAALKASTGGLSVIILEKSDKLGGSSAMSGAGTWIPANHVARAEGVDDNIEDALTYLRSASPEGWQEHEDELWQSFVTAAPRMLEFLEQESPLRFALTEEPDIFPEKPGGKTHGRMLAPKPLSRRILGPLAKKLRRSTLPHIFSYQEVQDNDVYHRPIRVVARLWPRLLWRLLTDTRGQGNALMTGLIKGCLDKGCRFETETRVVELSQDLDDGRVVGVVADTKDGRRQFHARRGVVLATGGFEWNKELFAKHFHGPVDRIASPRTNVGDGQILAQKAGALLENMDQVSVNPTLPTLYEGKIHGVPAPYQAEPHSILVDRTGNRFVSEYDFNIGESIDRHDPITHQPVHLPVWLIADKRYMMHSLPFRLFLRKDPNWLIRAGTLDELAIKTGLPVESLKQTVARFNQFCAQGRDDDFHRGEGMWDKFKTGGAANFFGTIERSPFYAMSFNRSVMGTKGGARTNARGQVLRPDRTAIPGLYAAGLAMANPIGTRAIGAGTTIGPNLTWGFICGEDLLTINRNGESLEQ